MGQTTFRKIEACHIPALEALDREAFFDPWSRNTWEHELKSPLARWYVLEDTGGEDGVAAEKVAADASAAGDGNDADGQSPEAAEDAAADSSVVGFAGFWLVAGEAQIMRVAVRQSCRNRGLGSLLTENLVEEAWKLGAEAIQLEVREGNGSAIRVYEKCGFRSAGIRPNYYADNGENAVIMWLYREDRNE